MKVLSALVDVRMNGIVLSKGERYVASDSIAGNIHEAGQGTIRIVADATAFTRPWRGEDLTGKRLLVYRPLGIGDEFIFARLAAIARDRYHAEQVGLAIYESHHSFWAATVDAPFRLMNTIIPWADWQSAHYHVAGEHLWEAIATVDQPDVYQIMAALCGIEIPPAECRPVIPTIPKDVAEQTAALIDPWLKDRPLVLWQIAASSRIRSYPPDQTDHAMAEILKNTDAAIVALGHPAQVAAYEIEESDRVAIYSGGIPGVIALVAMAAARKAVLVCPDSVVGHIAAAYPALPVISLWSAFDPRARVAYYPNHEPIFKRIKCSPCWAHEHNSNPAKYTGCPHTACNDYCAGLRSIPPAQICEAVTKALTPCKP